MSRQILLIVRNVSDKIFLGKIKTHFLCSITFSPENRAVCEKIRENMVDPDIVADENIVWRMLFAY
jgi:hypothetical protein